jgi:hypothetical protein
MKIRTVLRTTAAAAMLSVGTGAALAGPVVWEAASGGNGNSYEVILDTTVSWEEARSNARGGGGELASIDSQAEQSFVESVLSASNLPVGSYWFGIRETSTEGVYQSVSGTPQTYTNWLPGEPNNAGGVETVGAILWTPDGGDSNGLARRGRWNDEPVSGYPGDGLLTPAESDVFRAGFIVERTAATGGGNDGGGTPNAVPLPAAVFTFPAAAAFAGVFYRRMRRS